MNTKSIKYISILLISLILICAVLYTYGIKIVRINHGTYFTKEFYHYTIYIDKLGIEYFKKVNPNEISHIKVVASNETNNVNYFITFRDSIEVIVITDGLDTTRTVQLNYFTNIFINPSYQSVFIHSDSDENPRVFD